MKHKELVKIAEEELRDVIEMYTGLYTYDIEEFDTALERLKEALLND